MPRLYTQNILLDETKQLPKVRSLLDTISKNNSKESADIYLIGLAYFQTFLKKEKNKDLESILKPLEKNKIDRYELIQEFINYLNTGKLQPRSIKSYLTGVRVYLGTYKIYLLPQEYKYRVREPKIKRNEKEPLEVADIRKILLACGNRRLKAFLFVIASGGTRASETISIRLKDIDFNSIPTKITLRAEFTKMGKERYFFISDEAMTHLKNWIEYKYRKRQKEENNLVRNDTDYVFAVYDTRNPFHQGVYKTLSDEFNTLLESIGMDQRREGMTRRQITFHDFRTFVYSQVSDVDYNFAEWLLGHEHSTYWAKKEDVKKQKYLECMKYLRYIDPLENLGKDFESKMKEKDTEISLLQRRQKQLEETVTRLGQNTEFFMRKLNIPDDFIHPKKYPEAYSILTEKSEEMDSKRRKEQEEFQKWKRENPEEYSRSLEEFNKEYMKECPQCKKIGYNADISCSNCGFDRYPEEQGDFIVMPSKKRLCTKCRKVGSGISCSNCGHVFE